MNIKEELLREHSLTNAKAIAAFACSSNKNFNVLFSCFTADEYRLAQHAAWSVSWCAKMQPKIIKPYITKLVDIIDKPGVHDAVKRNSLRILKEINIPEDIHGILMDKCFTMIEDPKAPIAPKAFALQVLYNLTKIYPEIKDELKLVIEERMPTETAAFKSRGKKILKELK